jgi:hypothetical protein
MQDATTPLQGEKPSENNKQAGFMKVYIRTRPPVNSQEEDECWTIEPTASGKKLVLQVLLFVFCAQYCCICYEVHFRALDETLAYVPTAHSYQDRAWSLLTGLVLLCI